MRIMVIGASANRSKFGNKAVRAYLRQGHDVFPVNPHEQEIEGLHVCQSVSDVPGPIGRATIYLHQEQAMIVLRELAARGDIAELWLNPGADSPEVVKLARELGFEPIQACSIVDIGERP